MGRIVAMGGHERVEFFHYIVDLCGREKPHFLFVATASEDKTEYYAQISMRVSDLGCDTRPLYLFRRKYTKKQLDELFAWSDIIYVCGGDTYKMVHKWQECGVDAYLKKVFEEDSAVLCGSSAGGICWFRRGFSDASRTPEYPPHGWVDGIGIFPDRTFCPHFASRRDAYEQALRDSGEEGFGMADHSAYVYDNGKESFIRYDETCAVVVYTQGPDGLQMTEPEVLNLSEKYPAEEK